MRQAYYGQLTGVLSPFLESMRLRQALKHFPSEVSVLDIGCGRAALLDHTRPRHYVGVDRRPDVIPQNQSRYPGYAFVQADAESDLLTGLGRFDVILMLAVLEHFTGPETVLRRMVSLLAPKGRIIVTTPHPRGDRLHGYGARMGLCSSESHDEHYSLLDRAALHQLASRCGCRVVHFRRFLFGLNQLIVFQPHSALPLE